MLKSHEWATNRCIPHCGYQFDVYIAVGLGLYGMDAYPNVFVPFGKFGDNIHNSNGMVRLSEISVIGNELNPDLYSILKSLHTS